MEKKKLILSALTVAGLLTLSTNVQAENFDLQQITADQNPSIVTDKTNLEGACGEEACADE